MRLSPEIEHVAGAHGVNDRVGRVPAPQGPGVGDPAGVREQGEHTPGFPRNLRDLPLSIVKSALGVAEPEDPRPTGRASWPGGSETQDVPMVPPCEHRSRRDGRQESECLRSTCEVGELGPRGAGGGKEGIRSSDRWEETERGHRAPVLCQRKTNG